MAQSVTATTWTGPSFTLEVTELPDDDAFCTTERLPPDMSEQSGWMEQRIIASVRRHRNDVDHLERGRTRKAADRVSPGTALEHVGRDGRWRPLDEDAQP